MICIKKSVVPVEQEEVVQSVVRKGAKQRERMSIHMNPGDGDKYIGAALEMFQWGDIDIKQGVSVKKRCEEYFQLCIDHDKKPTIAGLAFALGIDRTYLWMIVKGGSNVPKESVEHMKRAYNLIGAMMEDWMQNGQINPVSGIFLMKNNLSYADKQEIVVTPNKSLGDDVDQAALEEKYDAIV